MERNQITEQIEENLEAELDALEQRIRTKIKAGNMGYRTSCLLED